MADKQALYRAKKAAVAATKLSKEDIRRLKAQKAKEPQGFGEPPSKIAKVLVNSSPAAASMMATNRTVANGASEPSNALQPRRGLGAPNSNGEEPVAPVPTALVNAQALTDTAAAPSASATAPPAATSTAVEQKGQGTGTAGMLPEDFFQSAAAATAALGDAAPKQPDLDEEMAKFTAAIRPDLTAMREEEEEADKEAAEEAAEREALEQRLRVQRLDELKRAAKERAATDVTVAPEFRAVALQGAASRRAKLLEGLLGDDEEEEDDSGEEDEVDWRAKRL